MIAMKDTCTLAETVSNGYGDKTIEELTDINCLFLQSTSRSHSNNVDIAEADAHAYLDIENPVIKNKGYRIEGMLLKSNPFGADDDECWYKINRVVIGQRKLLANDVDNVHVFLKKVAKP